MLFNSYPFLLAFLPGSLLAYSLVNRYPSLRIPTLLALSFLMYSYWNPPYLMLLVASIVGNWLAAQRFVATRNGAIITAAIVANLVVLGVFKYANFFADNMSVLAGHSI